MQENFLEKYTLDFSITRGFVSEACHPAVKGANISWPLNLS